MSELQSRSPASIAGESRPGPGEEEQRLVAALQVIERERMASLPLLNRALEVAVVGFSQWGGRDSSLRLGVVVTPWFMNLTLLAQGEESPWQQRSVGERIELTVGEEEFRFVVNEVDGYGRCLTHALYSPMHQFASQTDALDVAESLISRLTRPPQMDGKAGARRQQAGELQGESLEAAALERFMAGDDSVYNPLDPVNDPFASTTVAGEPAGDATASERKRREDERLSRRDLLWGRYVGGGAAGG